MRETFCPLFGLALAIAFTVANARADDIIFKRQFPDGMELTLLSETGKGHILKRVLDRGEEKDVAVDSRFTKFNLVLTNSHDRNGTVVWTKTYDEEADAGPGMAVARLYFLDVSVRDGEIMILYSVVGAIKLDVFAYDKKGVTSPLWGTTVCHQSDVIGRVHLATLNPTEDGLYVLLDREGPELWEVAKTGGTLVWKKDKAGS